ncbi:hypothetical protein KTE26_14205 [Ralstonia mannitolilytica]|uniref:hypothetical protein n=1 Tax=Ralstonia mannitolilytica TaxID=105219 RepID=UPI001C218B4F|nr:hypothetical protein [Ralstonia mannitolilytica]MBU9579583.1 hypothetical protein [Ralstonia mannitolilytica]
MDTWRIFFRCDQAKRDNYTDVQANSLIEADTRGDEYAERNGLTNFDVLCVAPMEAHQYRAA